MLHYLSCTARCAAATGSALALTLAAAPLVAQRVLFAEAFDSDANYTASTPEQSDGDRDFFGRIPPLVIAPQAYQVNGLSGAYFAAQDIDALDDVNGQSLAPLQFITFDPVDVTGVPDVEVSMKLAEDKIGATERWDATDYFHASYSVDGGATFTDLLNVEAEIATGSNAVPRVDTDFDGVGDGVAITEDAQTFTRRLDGLTAASLTLRLEFRFNAGEEDIAVDDVIVAVASDPLPVSLAHFGAATATGGAPTAQLTWTTLDERDHAYFEVEVAEAQGSAFSPVARIAGRGGADTRTDYGFAYAAPRAGRYYFRVAQVDFDGAVTYSPTVSALLEGDGGASLSEVAVTAEGVRFRSVSGGTVRLLDGLGRVVATAEAPPGSGVLETGVLPQGFYVLTDGEASVPVVR